MLKTFLAFTTKETLHILRDTRTLAVLFGMPLALVLIFGYTVTNEFKDAPIAIVNHAHDDLSRQLVSHLTASGHFLMADHPKNINQLEDSFKKGQVKMGLVIPNHFEYSFYQGSPIKLQLLADATEPNYAATLVNYAERMIMTFNRRHGGASAGGPIEIKTRMLYNPGLVGAYYFIPGVVALILMLICAMMTSLTIAKEKELGTMDLLLVSPLHPAIIVLGKVTPYAILSFVSALMVFAMGYLVFEVPVIGSLALLLLLTLLYLLVALTLGVLISTRAKTQQVAMIASMFALMLPTILLSGFIFPIASMPTLLQYISKIIPAKYFIIIEKSIMLKGTGWDVVLQPTLVLLLMLGLLLLATIKNFKIIYK